MTVIGLSDTGASKVSVTLPAQEQVRSMQQEQRWLLQGGTEMSIKMYSHNNNNNQSKRGLAD